MYPQVMRVSSIATGSTVQQVERPFVPHHAPEHPYAMYPQNTVAEEEDDGPLAHLSIPLGFPGMGQQYQGGRTPIRNDIADIVGADGHVEELPPYTRYADEFVPKEEVRDCSIPVDAAPIMEARADVRVAPHSAPIISPDNAVGLNTAITQTASSEKCGSLRERWKQNSRKRLCCGIPLWAVLPIIGVLLFGVLIGGIIGGVLAKKKSGAEAALPLAESSSYVHLSYALHITDRSPRPSSAVTITATTWLDAAPLSTNSPMPSIIWGEFKVPTDNLTSNSSSCVADPMYASAWGCGPPTGIGVTLAQSSGSGSTLPQIAFDPYAINATFSYGPQAPDLHGVPYPLSLSLDKDEEGLGRALFFSTFYDKLTIRKYFA